MFYLTLMNDKVFYGGKKQQLVKKTSNGNLRSFEKDFFFFLGSGNHTLTVFFLQLQQSSKKITITNGTQKRRSKFW